MTHGQFSNYMHSNKKIGQRIYTITFTFKKMNFLNAVKIYLNRNIFTDTIPMLVDKLTSCTTTIRRYVLL